MALITDIKRLKSQLEKVFAFRDESDISRKVLGRDWKGSNDIGGATAAASAENMANYISESYGSIDLNAIPGPESYRTEGTSAHSATNTSNGNAACTKKAEHEDSAGTPAVSSCHIAISGAPKRGFQPQPGRSIDNDETQAPSENVSRTDVNEETSTATTSPVISAVRRAIMEQSAKGRSPFEIFEQYSGDGHAENDCVNIQVYIPFAETMEDRHDTINVKVLSRATVKDCIGLVLAEYTRLERKPAVKPHADAYEFRMVEDDGEPDLDLPALDARHKISKFAFEHYCLCQGPKYATFTTSEAENCAAEPTPSMDKGGALLRVFTSDGVCTIKREAGMTVWDVIEYTVRRRALRTTYEYALELHNQEGVSLEPDTPLSKLDNTAGVSAQSTGALEFYLARKHCKRGSPEPVSSGHQRAVEQSLTIRQAKTWLLSKQKKFISNRVVEFTVHPQRITISPYGRSGLLTTKQRPVQIDMDQVLQCEREGDSAATFSLTYNDTDATGQRVAGKTSEFGASSAIEASEIVDKVNAIRKSRIRDTATAYVDKPGENQRRVSMKLRGSDG
eukprot:m.869898 g.869898  ORF g.869898 m.869898 type:complete len:563 (+) comp23564_c0_seq48:222-1910(+)